MTREHPGYAAAVRVAKRALAKRIAASATEKGTSTDTPAVAPLPTAVPPVPGK